MKASELCVKDFMTSCPHAIEPHETLALAQKKMRSLMVRHLPVRAAGRPVGILSEQDISTLDTVKIDLNKVQIAKLMTAEPYCVKPATPLHIVAAHMVETKISSALVVDDQDMLVGIFTMSDGLKALAAVT